MPTSWYHTIPRIMSRVLIEQPASVLDIGIGFGKYGLLLREALDIAHNRYTKDSWTAVINGIEAFGGYHNPVHDFIYNHVDYRPVEEALSDLISYDVILLIDIIEHIDKERGIKMIKELLLHTNKALIISTPVVPAYQQDYNGNTYERHISRWAITDFAPFKQDFSLVDIGLEKALIVKIYPNDTLIQKNKPLYEKDSLLTGIHAKTAGPRKPLRISFILPHKALTGGMKTILTQMRWLKERGHEITACCRSAGEAATALPDWNRFEVSRDVVLSTSESYEAVVKDCDVAVAGWVEQLPDLCKYGVPVVYMEQGSESLLGDLRVTGSFIDYHNTIERLYSMPCIFCTVSGFIADILESRFGRRAEIIPNGVDTEMFCPGIQPDKNVILLVGNPSLAFKGFETAMQALELAWHSGCRFTVNWICQKAPDIRGNSFPIQAIVNPPQNKLPLLFRQADIFLSSSWYEGFGMPPLEAMASGLAVICTDNGGSRMYIDPNQNAILVPAGDRISMAAAIQYLIENPHGVRQKLAVNARETALRYNLESMMVKFEDLLYRAVISGR